MSKHCDFTLIKLIKAPIKTSKNNPVRDVKLRHYPQFEKHLPPMSLRPYFSQSTLVLNILAKINANRFLKNLTLHLHLASWKQNIHALQFMSQIFCNNVVMDGCFLFNQTK